MSEESIDFKSTCALLDAIVARSEEAQQCLNEHRMLDAAKQFGLIEELAQIAQITSTE